MRTPPGVTSADFSAALEQFEQVLGKDWVFTSDDDIDTYRDAYSPVWHEEEEPIPSGAVAPDGVEQVQAVLRIANRYKIPLWTVSTGKNLGYGGSAPLLSGSVVLDLKRMNRVLEVNDKNHYALVEPGVSYFDLYRYIRERNLKAWIDPPDPGWGSPMGNSLERGGGRTPMHDHFAAVCGMEVVLANGEVIRTGMGALPGSKTWQQYKYGFGPYVDGMFSQSNFGVVTKMGVWLLPEPEACISGTVMVAKHDDLYPMIEIFANLVASGTVQATTQVTSPLAYVPANPELTAIRSSGSVKDLEEYGARHNIAYWSLPLPFYGPAKVVAAQWEYVKEKFSVIQGVRFEDGPSYRFPLSDDQVAKIADPVPYGIPSLQMFGVIGSHAVGHLGFSPIIPMTGEAVVESQQVFEKVYRDLGSPGGAAASFPVFWYFGRALVNIYLFPIVRDIEKNRQTRAIYRRLIKECAERGWGEYRTHTTFMGDIANTYSFNNHALLHLHETIKDAVDPNGILSPGKNGIWPKRMRKTTA